MFVLLRLIHKRRGALGRGLLPLLIFFLITVPVSFSILNKYAYAEEEESPFQEYDENTELFIKGKVVDISIPEQGPVILKVERENNIYTVILGPSWYYRKINCNINEGDTLEIIGTKILRQEKQIEVIIVARALRNLKTRTTYIFRGPKCACWQNCADRLCNKPFIKRMRSFIYYYQ